MGFGVGEGRVLRLAGGLRVMNAGGVEWYGL